MKKITHGSGIYCFENIENGYKYVGQGQDLRVRINQHNRHLKNGDDHSVYLQRAWIKYGEERFQIYIIEECEIELLNEREAYWIKELHSHVSEFGYNLSWGGESSLRGHHHSEETKKKMSESAKNQPPRSEEYRKNLSEGHKGYSPSLETRKKISEIGRLRKQTDETKKKISLANTGRVKSEEEKNKISEGNKGKPGSFKGKKHTEEAKKKQADARRGTRASEETKKKMSDARIGMKYSEERNNKISDSWTDERKKKASELKKNNPTTPEALKKISEKERGVKKGVPCSSEYIGVSSHKGNKKWIARIMTDEGRIHIGSFETEIEAALAYNEYALEYYGFKAKLNIVLDEDMKSIWNEDLLN